MLKEQLNGEREKVTRVIGYTFVKIFLDMMLVLVGIMFVYISLFTYAQKQNEELTIFGTAIGTVRGHIPYMGDVLDYTTASIGRSVILGALLVLCLLTFRFFWEKRREKEEIREMEEPEEVAKESAEVQRTEQLEIKDQINNFESKSVSAKEENQKNSLTLEKVIGGEMVNPLKNFDFTITFDDVVSYKYIRSNGQKHKLLEHKGKVGLKHGETITIQGLPTGLSYTIEEADYSKEGYFATVESVSGVILEKNNYIRFTNYEESQSAFGKLSVTKSVLGQCVNPEKEYIFYICFGDGNPYDYSVNGVVSGTVGGSGTVLLKEGETAEFIELPEGITYSVSERNSEGEFYSVKDQQISGKIVGNNKIQIEVMNKGLYTSLVVEEASNCKKELQDEGIVISNVVEMKEQAEQAEQKETKSEIQSNCKIVPSKEMDVQKTIHIGNIEVKKRTLIIGSIGILVAITIFHKRKK